MGLDWFHTAVPHQSLSSFGSQRGVFFLWRAQSIEHCYPDESNSIKKALHLGPSKRGLIRGQLRGECCSHPSSTVGGEQCWQSLHRLSFLLSCPQQEKHHGHPPKHSYQTEAWMFRIYTAGWSLFLARINHFLLTNSCTVIQMDRQTDWET